MYCKERVTAIALFVEGDLPEPECGQLAEHLHHCSQCRQVTRQLQDSQRWVKSLGQVEFPERIYERLQSRVMEEVTAAGNPRGAWFQAGWPFTPAWSLTWAGTAFLVIGLALWWSLKPSAPGKTVREEMPQLASVGAKQSNASKVDQPHTPVPNSSSGNVAGRGLGSKINASGNAPHGSLAMRQGNENQVARDLQAGARGCPVGRFYETTKATGIRRPEIDGHLAGSREEPSLAEVQLAMDRWMQMAALLELETEPARIEKEQAEKDLLVAKIQTNDPQVVIYWLKDAGKGKAHEIR